MIYLASSWRNDLQPTVVNVVRAHGFDVYDFRNPRPGDHGFSWKEIDGGWQKWTVEQYRIALATPIAQSGFASDRNALESADAVLLLLPCGASAHVEAAYAAGQGKPVAVLIPTPCRWEPELMYKLFGLVTDDINEAIDWLRVQTQV
jgi:hypothetical protein